MTEVQAYPSSTNNSYSFSSTRYFCSSCNRQFSQIKTDPTSTVARCPRCNLYADEVSPSRQVAQNHARTQPSQRPLQNGRNSPSNQNNENASYVQMRDPFGRVYLQPVILNYQQPQPQQRQARNNNFYSNQNMLFPQFNGFFGNQYEEFIPYTFFTTVIPNNGEGNAEQCGPAPASQEAINKLETVEFKAENTDAENNSCSICYEDYKQGEKLLKLPCKHDYHPECVKPWLAKHNSCPMCRKNI